MNKIEDTVSICEHCYRHISAMRFERDGKIWLGKSCDTHGYIENVVENDAEFYLNYKYVRRPLESYFLEITNRCNLTCAHCYQIPNNKSKDPSITSIINTINSWPDDGFSVALVGAEPTVRKDLTDLIHSINNMNKTQRRSMILTNGINLSNKEYAKKFTIFKNLWFTIGLNHFSYHTPTIRQKQIDGINNLKELNLVIKCISYTLEDISQLEDCLLEMKKFGVNMCNQYRIRCGADIGRNPGGPKIFLSDLVLETTRVCKKYGWHFERELTEGNRAHYSAFIDNLWIKIIQWPDAKTLDLYEVQTEAIGDILPGKPRSPLVHQVLLRDGAINKGIPLLDTIPQEYIDNYGHTRDKRYSIF
jgi:MoaA/NifB/PqqE/SkfB family radical SAM enzyme